MFNDKIDTPNLADFFRVKQDNNNFAGLTYCVKATNQNLLLLILPLCTISTQLETIPAAIKENPKIINKLRLKPYISLQHHSNQIKLKG